MQFYAILLEMDAFFKSLLVVLLLYWSYYLLFSVQPWIFLDGVNLIFHEAGHWIFWILGEFMHVLGGSLLQCVIPLGIGVYFLITQQFFSSAFCLFWLGDNLINVSVYIRDSRAMILPLLGGEGAIHDWNWILSCLNLLSLDQYIGDFFWWWGALCVVVSLGFCFYLIIREILSRESHESASLL
jgi:hypothetical protein